MTANLKIKFLGTGDAFSKKFGNTSAIVSVSSDEGFTQNLLVDCGRTTPQDMSEYGIGWNNVDAIFITHLHGDHVYGLEEAGFVGRFVTGKKPTLILPNKKIKNDLWNRVLRGTMERADLNRNMTMQDYFNIQIVEDQYFMFNGVMFSVFRTEHVANKKSYGLIIGEEDCVVYSGDSLCNAEFLKGMDEYGVQQIFHDCTTLDINDDSDGRIHANISDIISLPDGIKHKIKIMHYQDNLPDHYFTLKDEGIDITIPGVEYEYQVDTLSVDAILGGIVK